MNTVFNILLLCGAAAHARAASSCHDDALNNLRAAKTSYAKCNTVDTFARCIAALAAGSDVSQLENQLTSMQATVFASEGCKVREVRTAPEMKTSDGNLDITVDSGKDVNFARYRRETVSLFDLAASVKTMETTVDQKLADGIKAMDTVKDTLTKVTAEQFDKRAAAQNAKAAEQKKIVDDLVSGVSKKLSAIDDKLLTSNKALTASLTKTMNEFRTAQGSELKKVQTALALDEKCSSEGKVVSSGKCVLNTEKNTKLKCDTNSVGATRYNVDKSRTEVCSKSGSAFEFKALSSGGDREKGDGTKDKPARNGMEIWEVTKGKAKTGFFWIMPEGETKAAETMCEFGSDTNMRGACLASYGYICSTGSSSCNFNLLQMNLKNGYQWTPKNRPGRHGLINLPQGAVMMGKSATRMFMAAARSTKHNNNGLASYSHIYEADISEHSKHVDFTNHARGGGGCGMQLVQYRVRTLKGDGDTKWRQRHSTKEALGITWSDSHPTGYGFSNQISSRTRACDGSNWSDGPFFPSVQSGPYPWRTSNSAGGRKTFPGMATSTNARYTHRGWYGMNHGQYNRWGTLSIWFK